MPGGTWNVNSNYGLHRYLAAVAPYELNNTLPSVRLMSKEEASQEVPRQEEQKEERKDEKTEARYHPYSLITGFTPIKEIELEFPMIDVAPAWVDGQRQERAYAFRIDSSGTTRECDLHALIGMSLHEMREADFTELVHAGKN